jgi:hypothetical protein
VEEKSRKTRRPIKSAQRILLFKNHNPHDTLPLLLVNGNVRNLNSETDALSDFVKDHIDRRTDKGGDPLLFQPRLHGQMGATFHLKGKKGVAFIPMTTSDVFPSISWRSI